MESKLLQCRRCRRKFKIKTGLDKDKTGHLKSGLYFLYEMCYHCLKAVCTRKFSFFQRNLRTLNFVQGSDRLTAVTEYTLKYRLNTLIMKGREKPMKVLVAYFSAETGKTRKIAEKLAKSLNARPTYCSLVPL